MIEEAVSAWPLDDLDFLFIENVGNLVCPASYDLGEHMRLVLMSVTEGEDKPLKYPTIFNSADVAVVTKVDLALAAGFDWPTALVSIEAVRPGITILQVSAKSGEGMAGWLAFLIRGPDLPTRARDGPRGFEVLQPPGLTRPLVPPPPASPVIRTNLRSRGSGRNQ